VVNDDKRDGRNAEQSPETDDSRRRFLAGSAGTVGALAVGSAVGVGSVLGGDDEDDGMADDSMEFEDDVAILNYALTLEYLEAAFYRRALENIDRDDLLCDLPEELAHFEEYSDEVLDEIYGRFEVIRDHEETHAETLATVIEDLGGEPIDEPEFDFGEAVEDPVTFIQTAAVLEDTGVGAYAGAAPFIENEDLVPPALSIHSVEARHASFVRELGGEIGFPDAFDEALSRDEVLEAAGQFIVEE